MMTASDVLIPRLEALLGASAVRGGVAEIASYAIGDCPPAVAVQPETAEQVVEVLSLAAHERTESLLRWGR
jgi:hypothetical protein